MNRVPIPRNVKEQLRSESGFGCCFCGVPILQYHHIVPYSLEAHNRPEDMMAVCPLCHDKITKGAIPESRQRQAKENPFNLKRGRVKGCLEMAQDFCAVQIGLTFIVGQGPIIKVDDDEIFGLYLSSEKTLELTLRLFDEDNNLILDIQRNEWISSNLPWDIRADWQKIKIRAKRRDVLLDIDATDLPISVKGKLWTSNGTIKLSNQGVHINFGPQLTVYKAAFINIGINVNTNNNSPKIFVDESPYIGMSLMNPHMQGAILPEGKTLKQMQLEAITEYKRFAAEEEKNRHHPNS